MTFGQKSERTDDTMKKDYEEDCEEDSADVYLCGVCDINVS